ncbi:hypothetical protein [Ekhidna sp. To15]|uniref:hypothetical protein n=1 Tax=Ekhidna sp. To15 TaxID=3395267 RepID=UPI003F52582D
MKTHYLFIFFFSISISLVGQEIKFRNSDQKLILKQGDLVRIQADTAYLISRERAVLLNEKLDQLENTRKTNAQLKTINEDLLDKVKEVEKLVTKLLKRMESSSAEADVDLEQILNDLDRNLASLKQNNSELAKNNQDLKKQIGEMDQTINKLKQEIRGIWWNGFTDKIVVGVLGIGLGYVIGVL